MLRLSSGEN